MRILLKSPGFSTGDALRQQEPPGDDVLVPGVDDHFHVLVEQIAIANFQTHLMERNKMEANGFMLTPNQCKRRFGRLAISAMCLF